jgi:hypothetical protein
MSVLFFGHRKRFDAIVVNSDVFEKAILGFLFFTDGFSTLDIRSVMFMNFIENAERRDRFISAI